MFVELFVRLLILLGFGGLVGWVPILAYSTKPGHHFTYWSAIGMVGSIVVGLVCFMAAEHLLDKNPWLLKPAEEDS